MNISHLPSSFLVKKGKKISETAKGFFKYNHPEATLIIYGTLELSGDKIHSHIHAKNLVITPTGTLILENAQLLIEENLKNFGNLILTHSVCHAKYTVIGGADLK